MSHKMNGRRIRTTCCAEGQAGLGDLFRTPTGEVREVVACESAGDYLERLSREQIRAPQAPDEHSALHGGRRRRACMD